MNTVIRILTTPSCWIRNYRTDKTVDRFIRTLVEHKDEVEEIRYGNCTIYLKFRGKVYELWTSNKWYGYLSDIYLIPSFDDTYRREKACTNKMPSRGACFLFYDTFEVLVNKAKGLEKTKFLEDAIKSEEVKE